MPEPVEGAAVLAAGRDIILNDLKQVEHQQLLDSEEVINGRNGQRTDDRISVDVIISREQGIRDVT